MTIQHKNIKMQVKVYCLKYEAILLLKRLKFLKISIFSLLDISLKRDRTRGIKDEFLTLRRHLIL